MEGAHHRHRAIRRFDPASRKYELAGHEPVGRMALAHEHLRVAASSVDDDQRGRINRA
jgi:hypothetical protein